MRKGVKKLRKDWRENLLLILTCAVLFGSVGYFLGARNHGAVYEISGAAVSASYEEPVTLSESPVTPNKAPEETQIKLNLNTATVEELVELPGIGESKAAAIVAYREEHGPFQTPEDLLLVSGIGEATLEGLAELVTVEEADGKDSDT